VTAGVAGRGQYSQKRIDGRLRPDGGERWDAAELALIKGLEDRPVSQ
jgi:hypothetical protein